MARFRIFRYPINVYCPTGFTDGEDSEGNAINGGWREHTIGDNGLHKIGKLGSNHYSWTAKSVRESFSDYFSSPEGAVPWQDKHIHWTSYN